MKTRNINPDLRLIPYYPNYETTLKWYQDLELCKQVDNIDHPYSLDLLKSMYQFLDAHGECFYIEYQGTLAGDVTLRNDNQEISIVICRDFQNRHIGRKVIGEILSLAKEKNFSKVFAHIYPFNLQSRKMFLSVGFRQTDEEIFEYSFL